MDRWSRIIALAGLILALIGMWGAWVPHRAAALVLSGWDLAEFVKFLPDTTMTREVFYLPVWCIGVALAVIAAQAGTSTVARFLLVALALALMLMLLPPYPHIFDGYQSNEFRWRFILGISGVLLVLGLTLLSRVPRVSDRSRIRPSGALLLGLALFGVVPALRQFMQAQASIETIYGASLDWGWGLVVFLAGWLVVGVVGARTLVLGIRE